MFPQTYHILFMQQRTSILKIAIDLPAVQIPILQKSLVANEHIKWQPAFHQWYADAPDARPTRRG